MTVVEKADRAGGLLMYGIPNMKLPKDVVERRVALMRELGIEFRLETDASEADVAEGLLADFDAVVVAAGAGAPRGLGAEGFNEGLEAGGVVFAVDYLTSATKAVLAGGAPAIDAVGKDVVVIGGGDTGNDCLGTAVRQGARSVRQLEFMPCAPEVPVATNAWPQWPNVKKTDYGQQEAIALMGAEMREWAVDTLEVLRDEKGAVSGIRVVDLDWSAGRPERRMETERVMGAQLVLIACGFIGPKADVLSALGVELAHEGRPLPVMACRCSHRAAGEKRAGKASVYVAGDARNGSSLVVSAIADAMACASEVAAELGL